MRGRVLAYQGRVDEFRQWLKTFHDAKAAGCLRGYCPGTVCEGISCIHVLRILWRSLGKEV